MSFAGVVFACWLGIAGVAFFAFSGLARLAARGDVEADLGIVGETELRVLLGERDEQRPSLEARLAQFGVPSAQMAWMSSDGAGRGVAHYTGARGVARYTGAGYTT